jgi:hypothetical protein
VEAKSANGQHPVVSVPTPPEENEAAFKALRQPFPQESIGILPKQIRRNTPESEKKHCDTCGATIGPHVHLSYVGWSTVVSRLLDNDLHWEWDAYAHDQFGLPMYRDSPNGLEVELWIRLTIRGQTRVGVGIVDKSESDLGKKLVSDALKNAGNKFGIALDLWSKDELEYLIGTAAASATRKRRPPKGSTPIDNGEPAKGKATKPAGDHMTAPDRNKVMVALRRLPEPVIGDEAVLAWVAEKLMLTEPPKALSELSAFQGQRVLTALGHAAAVPPEDAGAPSTAPKPGGGANTDAASPDQATDQDEGRPF